MDGPPAYAGAVADLKADRRARSTLSLSNGAYLNNIIEQDHRFNKEADYGEPGFRSVEVACRTIAGYAAMHAIRKGQVRWVAKGDAIEQREFIRTILGIAP